MPACEVEQLVCIGMRCKLKLRGGYADPRGMEGRGTYGSGAGERGHVRGGELSRIGRLGCTARGQTALGAARGGDGGRGGGGRLDWAQRGAAERRHRERLANWRKDSEKSEIW